jgi:hypothetical protein
MYKINKNKNIELVELKKMNRIKIKRIKNLKKINHHRRHFSFSFSPLQTDHPTMMN